MPSDKDRDPRDRQDKPLQRYPENSMQTALRDVSGRMQEIRYKYETSPPLSRSDILARARRQLSDLDVLVGRKDGSAMFRLALIDAAAYLIWAAASCSDKSIGIE